MSLIRMLRDCERGVLCTMIKFNGQTDETAVMWMVCFTFRPLCLSGRI